MTWKNAVGAIWSEIRSSFWISIFHQFFFLSGDIAQNACVYTFELDSKEGYGGFRGQQGVWGGGEEREREGGGNDLIIRLRP